ncbi:MAG: CheR family methyltransferase [Bacteroidales bacterium]
MIVGIGASAGGLNALRKLFSKIPGDSGMAYVVVVHLSPEHKSMLPELIQPYVDMPVIQVTETVALKPDHVYVIPPNANLNSIDTHLRLSELEEERGQRAPVDHFFRTLSTTHDSHAIGIILTGTGSDGTLGIKEIKENGGLTIVQDPNEAEYDGMPRNAISTGLVDLVLPISEIPGNCIRYFRTSPLLKSIDAEKLPRDEEKQLQGIFAQVKSRTGRDFSKYKLSTLLRRIQRRMQIHHILSLEEYLEFLRKNADEVHSLSDDFLINVTNFFRDKEVYDYLENEVLPEIIRKKNPDEQIRVWSVGCATGEEAYSLAMILTEAMEKHEAIPAIQVFATDLHEISLKKAREGYFPGDINIDVSSQRLKRFFIKQDDGYRIRKELREQVVFTPHNLLADPPFSYLDLIMCRNLLIYLKRDVQHEVYELFHYALLSRGYLVLGTSEHVERPELFGTENKEFSVYIRRNVSVPELKLPVFPRVPGRFKGETIQEKEPPRIPFGELHHKIIEQYAPPSIILGSDYQVLHVSKTAGRYLKIPGGEISRDVFRLVRPELEMELRAAIYTSREEKKMIRSKPVTVSLNGEMKQVFLSSRVVNDPEMEEVILVLFEEYDPPRRAKKEDRDQKDFLPYTNRVNELEQELQETRQRLQATIEEYETSREEMKASNEELQSSNEELRSTMEELETSKEELQSVNEELTTLNQENLHKVEELSQMSGDLQNLLASTNIATLFLDRKLRIMRFTPKLGELFNVRQADLGRPIDDQTNKLGYDQLSGDAEKVLRDLQPLEREVKDQGGNIYLTRVLPYLTSEDKIAGVVITFIDITRRKRVEEELRESEKRFRALVEATSFVIFRMSPDWGEMRELDGHGIITDTKRPDKQWMNKYIHPEDRPEMEKAIDKAIRTRSAFSMELRIRLADGSTGWTFTRAVPLLDDGGEIMEWFGAASDISSQVRAEQAFRGSENRRLMAFEAAGIGDWWLDPETKETYWSKKVRELLGVGQDEQPDFNKSLTVIHPDDRQRVIDEINRVTGPEGTGEYEVEFRVIHPDGKEIWVNSRARMLDFGLPDQEPGRYLYGAMVDITEHKETIDELHRAKAEAEKAARAKEDFLAHISHEIRTPLHAIVGLSHLLLQRDPKKEQMGNLKSLKISAENLSRLINDVLDYSRIESGKATKEEIAFNLEEFLEKTVSFHRTIAEEKKIGLETRVDKKVPENIICDQMILSNVLHNLLSNAVKFTSEGQVTLDVELKKKKRDSLLLEFSVSDTGVGIPEEKMEIIFDEFSQADNSTVRQYGGTGLGLAISRLYLKMMGSRIEVESKRGKGSRFFFELTVKPVGKIKVEREEADNVKPEEADLSFVQVLLVEDDHYNQMILKQLMAMWGLDFDVAENGLKAVEKAKKKKYNLILMDLHMPVMDGFEAARKIRKLSGYQDTNIIALTADISDRIKKELRSGLFSDINIKPFEPEKLNRKIAEIAAREKSKK